MMIEEVKFRSYLILRVLFFQYKRNDTKKQMNHKVNFC